MYLSKQKENEDVLYLIAKYLHDHGLNYTSKVLCKEADLSADVFINKDADLSRMYKLYCSQFSQQPSIVEKWQKADDGDSTKSTSEHELFPMKMLFAAEDSGDDESSSSSSNEKFHSCTNLRRKAGLGNKWKGVLDDFDQSFTETLKDFIDQNADYEDIALLLSRFALSM